MAEHSVAIKRIDSEIQSYNQSKIDNSEDDMINEVKIKEPENRNFKKCRYFNRGHCKTKSECKFSHPTEICPIYLEKGKCEGKNCPRRHQKVCKWLKTATGCRRQDCDFLHDTIARDDGKTVT